MMGILQTLSSYSVQFITTINSSNVRLSDDGYIRVGDIDITASAEIDIVDINIDIQDVSASAEQDVRFEMIDPDMINVEQSATVNEYIELQNLIHIDPVEIEYYYEVNPIDIKFHPSPPLQPNDEGLVPVVGIEYFLALTLEQQQQFSDVYNNPYWPIEEQVLSRVISTYYASGLVWNQSPTPIEDLILENPSPGLVWNRNQTTPLSSIIVETHSDGLVFNPGNVPISSTILVTVSPSLIYWPDPTPLQYSLAYRNAGGLNYGESADPAPMYFSFMINDASGLVFIPDTDESSSD
jgi:hypothetical protein